MLNGANNTHLANVSSAQINHAQEMTSNEPLDGHMTNIMPVSDLATGRAADTNETSSRRATDERPLSAVEELDAETVLKTQSLASAAESLHFCDSLGLPCRMDFSGAHLPASKSLTGAVSKTLNGLQTLPELLDSKYWDGLEPEYATAQKALFAQFINAGQPMTGRVRVDSVVCGIDEDDVSTQIAEFEPHCGGDLFLTRLTKVFKAADQGDLDYIKDFAKHLKAESPNQAGKIRYVQWPTEMRTDIDYSPTIERLMEALREEGLDAKQFLYNDPSADWDDALVYRLFEFSEIDHDKDQQMLVEGHEAGKWKFANPAFAFGKLVPLFAHEFKDSFQEKLGMSEAEMKVFPFTVSAAEYLKSESLQEAYPYQSMFLKGVFSEGSGGANDVIPLKKFESLDEAKAYIKQRNDDGRGGWIVQAEIPRARRDIIQQQEGGTQIHHNRSAGSLQRQIFMNRELYTHYNVSSSRLKGAGKDDTMHAEEGVAIYK
jgi:hypothetical protein